MLHIHKQNRKMLPLKTAFYSTFLFLIVIPLLIVLIVALLALNQQFKKQAIENMRQAQETISAELLSDIKVMSMRLSHLIYTNNNEILAYAAGTDTSNQSIRYEYEEKLEKAISLALEPVKNIVSVGFYMKDDREIFIKNEIGRTTTQIKESKWYQMALLSPNKVVTGSYHNTKTNDLYTGAKKDMLILVFALAPDVTTDRSQSIEMVTFYQSTGAADRIKKYNQEYLTGKNTLGITQIVDAEGECVFSTHPQEYADMLAGEYTCVRSSIEFHEAVWYIESYVKTAHLTSDFWNIAIIILAAAILILLLAGFYSRYFLRSIVRPVEEISSGLRNVEEGNLEVHITPIGQFEVRTMIYQFNAMVRRLKVLIDEYEERMKSAEKTPEDYFAAMIRGEMTLEEVNKHSGGFFMERYVLLGFFIEQYHNSDNETGSIDQLAYSFERNPLFASRCILYKENSELFFIFYRITEEEYLPRIKKMITDIQKTGIAEFSLEITAFIGQEAFGYAEFLKQVEDIRGKICLRHLHGLSAIIELDCAVPWEHIIALAGQYTKLADALYTADEKNVVDEKEKLFELFHGHAREEISYHVYGTILAIGNRFSMDNISFTDVFGRKYDYLEKIQKIDELRSLKLWLTNYFAWIMDYSAAKLDMVETDVIIKAKRYLQDHYEDKELSLIKVAEYVGLNEKYFTNRFTKETGENFSAYLTGLRMQKAKELLKTTNFKVYEIAEMVGYQNPEHFNRMFKKINSISPMKYRKS